MDELTRREIKNKLPEVLKFYGAKEPRNEKGNWDCIPTRHTNNKADLSIKGEVCACHCGLKGDSFNVIAEMEGLTTFPEIAEKAMLILNITETETKKTVSKANDTKEANENKINIDKFHAKAGETDYFKSRGLTEKTINKYKLGYNATDTHCYYLPVNEDYVIRRAGEGAEPRYKNPVGASQILNLKYISDDTKQVFITEGFFDALSLEELGYYAISLNSTSNNKKLLEKLENHYSKSKTKLFILIADNDKAGAKLIIDMQQAFKGLKIPLEVINLPEGINDINEYLINDTEGLKSLINKKLDSILYGDFVYSYLPDFLKDIKLNKEKPIISTGFLQLNKKLNGGIFPGLYCIGAISSLGKTAFTLQLADNIASRGTNVIFFSLEMSKIELISRSISRELININRDKYRNYGTNVISRGQFSNQDLPDISTAIENYEETSKHLIIQEGNFDTEVDDIRTTVQAHLNKTGQKPVVIIDYLQILRGKGSGNDKQEVDYISTELKRISRDFDIPVIVVSSFSRAYYNTPVSMESFKESGSIEYTSDVLIGLQLTILGELEQSEKKKAENKVAISNAKMENPRKVTLVVLKQRNGLAYATHDFLFYPVNNLFREVDAR